MLYLWKMFGLIMCDKKICIEFISLGYRPCIELDWVDALLPVSFIVIGHCIGILLNAGNASTITMLITPVKAKMTQTKKIILRLVILNYRYYTLYELE